MGNGILTASVIVGTIAAGFAAAILNGRKSSAIPVADGMSTRANVKTHKSCASTP